MPQVKSIFRYLTKEHDKEQFKQSQCLITISVGQQTHEGERFLSTVNLLNESCASCIILMGDSLQRHTMALIGSDTADSFYEPSIKEGDLWLERNKKYYSKLKTLKKILRWDTWLQHKNFIETQNKILALIKKDPTYKAAFDNSIH